MHTNRLRGEPRQRKAAARRSAKGVHEELSEKLRDINAEAKALRQQLKAHKEATGVKKKQSKSASKYKTALDDSSTLAADGSPPYDLTSRSSADAASSPSLSVSTLVDTTTSASRSASSVATVTDTASKLSAGVSGQGSHDNVTTPNPLLSRQDHMPSSITTIQRTPRDSTVTSQTPTTYTALGIQHRLPTIIPDTIVITHRTGMGHQGQHLTIATRVHPGLDRLILILCFLTSHICRST